MANMAIVGGGPAGLMAAELLATAGHGVTVYDAMPSPARKLLLAGKGDRSAGVQCADDQPWRWRRRPSAPQHKMRLFEKEDVRGASKSGKASRITKSIGHGNFPQKNPKQRRRAGAIYNTQLEPRHLAVLSI